jgi:Zn-dependent peptidase ImmA (M78 family)
MMILSTYDKNNEDEANWLAGALLLPREALVHARKHGLTNEAVATHFGCSVQLLTFRINATGVDVQLRRAKTTRR